MAHPKAQRCPCCGYAAVIPSARPGRVVRYRNAALTLPANLHNLCCGASRWHGLGARVGEGFSGLPRTSVQTRLASI